MKSIAIADIHFFLKPEVGRHKDATQTQIFTPWNFLMSIFVFSTEFTTGNHLMPKESMKVMTLQANDASLGILRTVSTFSSLSTLNTFSKVGPPK